MESDAVTGYTPRGAQAAQPAYSGAVGEPMMGLNPTQKQVPLSFNLENIEHTSNTYFAVL